MNEYCVIAVNTVHFWRIKSMECNVSNEGRSSRKPVTFKRFESNKTA